MPISWAIHREVVLLAGWARAILMQVAHPRIAQAIAEHSAFQREGFGRWRRLQRTLTAMLMLTFGTEAEARATVAHINGIHRRVHGPGYSATDPALLRWVHLTCVDSFMLTYETFVRPLSAAERDAYCAESAGLEVALGMPAGYLPRSAQALSDAVAAMLAGGELTVAATGRRLARDIMHPPLDALIWPVTALTRLTTVALLPPVLRAAYGYAWDRRRQRVVRATAATVRGLLPLTPARLRQWPLARRAIARETARRGAEFAVL